MPKPDTKTQIKVIVDIKPVKLEEITPRQRQLWRQCWTCLIAECQRQLKAESDVNKHE